MPEGSGMKVLAIAPSPVSSTAFEERWHMCFRKLHFYSEGEAKKAGKKRKKYGAKAMYVYECPVHQPQHWHLTKMPEHLDRKNESVR